MSDVYFTTNPADFSKLEGLYVSERAPTGFIRGADLSTVGIAARCVRGPSAPQLITSGGGFVAMYGEADNAAGLGGAVIGQGWQALLNKPFGSLVIRRVIAADAVIGTHTFSDVTPTAILRVDASSPGAWAAGVTVAIETATDANATHFNVRVSYLGDELLYQNVDFTAGHDNSLALVGTDPTRYVNLVKLADGRPLNAVATALTTGSDGTLVVGDYNAGMNDLAAYPGVSICLVPEAVAGSAATYHSNLVTLAAGVSDRIFLTWAQTHGQSVATEAAQVAAQITTRSDRIVWCYNSPYTLNPKTSAEVQTAPHVWLASILSQTDVDVHAGSFETLAFLAGITRLTATALTRQDLITLKNAGISTIENNTDGPQFRSVVTTSLVSGKTELTRRRMCDFLQLSAASRLRYYVKRKNTATIRAAMAGELTSFSVDLRSRERVVEDFEIDSDSVNTQQQRDQGEEHLLWRVKLIGHILALVLETDISTGTVIERK